jgi:diacylglycerol kinase family enzyme
MKALSMDNVQKDAEPRRLLREALRRHFPAARLDYVIHEARDGESLADVVRRRLCDGIGLVVAVGGDGTVSAVCDGFLGQYRSARHHPQAKFIPAVRIVRIRSGAPLPVQGDGDIIGATPIEVTVMPHALTVWAPVPHAESPPARAPSQHHGKAQS